MAFTVFIKITGDEKELSIFNSLFYKGTLSYEYKDGEFTSYNHAFTFDNILPIRKSFKNKRLMRCREKLWGFHLDISETFVYDMLGDECMSIPFHCERYFIDSCKFEAEFFIEQFRYDDIKIQKFFKFASLIFENLEFTIHKYAFEYPFFEYFKFKNGETIENEYGICDDTEDYYMKYWDFTLAMAINYTYGSSFYDFIGEKIEKKIKTKSIDEIVEEEDDVEFILYALDKRGISLDELFSQKRLPDAIEIKE